MNIYRIIKKYFDFLLNYGYKRKKYSKNGDYEICYFKSGVDINILYSLVLRSNIEIDDIEWTKFDLNELSEYSIDIIIQKGNYRQNILYNDLFDIQSRKKLKSDIEEIANHDLEQTLKIYSLFIKDNISKFI